MNKKGEFGFEIILILLGLVIFFMMYQPLEAVLIGIAPVFDEPYERFIIIFTIPAILLGFIKLIWSKNLGVLGGTQE